MTLTTPPEPAGRRRRELVDWFLRRQAGPWSSADERAFRRWLEAEAGNAAAWQRWLEDWDRIDAMPAESAEQLRAQVRADRLAAAVDAAERAAAGRRRWWRLAGAGGFAALAVAGGWLGWQALQAEPDFVQELQTARGELSDVTLPDGSQLRLDAATVLQVTLRRDRREVRLLEGQTQFTVRADAARPFVVLAGPVRVTVVGTRFTVRSTPGVPGRDGVEVAVEEGRVRVARLDDAEIELQAGQQIAFGRDGGRGPVRPVAAHGIAPWRERQLSFSDVPVGTALAELARYADLGVVAVDPAVAELRVTGTFDAGDAAATRRLLARALPVRIETVAGGFALRPSR